MSGLYANTGVDLDLILYTGSGAQTTEIYDDTGLDIGLKYSAGDTGYALGFQVHDGRDIGRILGGEVAAVWRSKRTSNVNSESTAVSDGWALVNQFKSQRNDWTKIGTTESITIGSHRTPPFKTKSPYNAYAFHVVANSVGSTVEVSLGSPSSSSGWVKINEIRKPNDYTTNFVVVGCGGDRYETKYKLVEDGDSSPHYEPYYEAVYSKIPLTIKLKVGEAATRTHTVTLEF